MVVVLGWAVFVYLLVMGTLMLFPRSPDSGVRWMMRSQGVFFLASCALSLIVPIAKLWFIVAIPVGMWFPMFLMGRNVKGMQSKLAGWQEESDRTGIPLAEIVQRETERQKSP